ncbi:hypothetical protein LOTGIDRAFT_139361, partial [Lottia gigantea]
RLNASNFFFSGLGDKVICFCCGVAIFNWAPSANSWEQHALVSPQCLFILHEKGSEFIREMAAIQV